MEGDSPLGNGVPQHSLVLPFPLFKVQKNSFVIPEFFFKMTDKQVRTMGLKATNMNEQMRAKAFNSGDEINSEVHDQCHAFHLA